MSQMLNGSPKFQRYDSATLESPLWHLLLVHCGYLIRNLYRLRWFLTRPLQCLLLPCLPVVDLPILRSLANITVGQCILTFPLIAMFIVSYEATFVDPAKTSGYMATDAMLATILLANKSNSVLSFLFGLSYERVVPMHRTAALLTLLLSCFHVRVAFVNTVKHAVVKADQPIANQNQDNAAMDDRNTVWEFFWDGYINVTGTLALVCVSLLICSSFFRVFRKYGFDIWLISHILFSLFGIAFCIAHKGYNIGYAAAWWSLDWFIRKIVMATYGLPRKALIRTIATGNVVELRMDSFSFRAGQFIRLAVPELGTVFFHPFTISSAPSDPEVVLHIKPVGDWTRRLLELCSRRVAIDVLVEGPYGGMSMDLDNDSLYPIVLCLAGGSGITPCRSIARQLIFDGTRGRQLMKVQVIWAVRDLAIVRDIPISQSRGESVEDGTAPNDCRDENEASQCCESSVSSVGELSVDIYSGISVDQFIDAEQHSTGSIYTSVAVDEPKMQTDIYLTKESDNDGESLVFPQLDNCHIYRGRPPIFQILSELGSLAARKEVSHVAVICCGHKTFVDQARQACRALNGCFACVDVSFDFHEEVFEY